MSQPLLTIFFKQFFGLPLRRIKLCVLLPAFLKRKILNLIIFE